INILSGTLLLSGSTAVTTGNMLFGPGPGTLRSIVTGVLFNPIAFSISTFGRISAAGGQTLTLVGLFDLSNPNTHAIFGSATDTGTVVLAPAFPTPSSGSTIEVAGGTLRIGGAGSFQLQTVASVTVDAGATLDLTSFSTIRSLLGAGTVVNPV